jgi:hypothetical protein
MAVSVPGQAIGADYNAISLSKREQSRPRSICELPLPNGGNDSITVPCVMTATLLVRNGEVYNR